MTRPNHGDRLPLTDRERTGLNTALLDRRAFLKRLGGGIAVACLATGRHRSAFGQAMDHERRPFAGDKEPEAISAWLHVDGQGRVTVYTGKVELGQNVRTSLGQVVAEELRVPFDSVDLIMGDTAQVPFDNGTFASQTTPIMGLQLRKAAAAAREELEATAAERWQVTPDEVAARDGKVVRQRDGTALTYGELAAGQEFVGVVDDAIELTRTETWVVAGTSVPKRNARDIVTGRHRFASDWKRPGMWHGKVLRPPAYGAKLASVDLSAARGMPNVVAVHDDQFVGVAAPDEATAARALAAIQATWDPPAATCNDRNLHAYLVDNARPSGSDPSRIQQGSIEEGKRASSQTVEASYTAAFIAHAPLEPRGAVAEWAGDNLTIWTGTQRPFGALMELMRVFELPRERIRVLVPDTGSGYGGKHSAELEVETARLARAAGRPVRVGWTREEEFAWGYFRPAGVVETAAGLDSQGRLAFWSFENINSGTAGLDTPYRVPHRAVEFRPSRPPMRQGAYRALASTLNHFARESLMDELARAAHQDPLSFRLAHLDDERLIATLQAAVAKFGWRDWTRQEGRGIGLACGAEKGSCVAACVEIALDGPGGSLRVTRVVQAFQPGSIVNPDQMASQVEGAVAMGIGGALFESMRFEDGVLRNGQFSRYRMPRPRDVPSIEVVLLNRPELLPTGGGEIPIVAIAPALANAIHDATGQRLRSLPLAPAGRL